MYLRVGHLQIKFHRNRIIGKKVINTFSRSTPSPLRCKHRFLRIKQKRVDGFFCNLNWRRVWGWASSSLNFVEIYNVEKKLLTNLYLNHPYFSGTRHIYRGSWCSGQLRRLKKKVSSSSKIFERRGLLIVVHMLYMAKFDFPWKKLPR